MLKEAVIGKTLKIILKFQVFLIRLRRRQRPVELGERQGVRLRLQRQDLDRDAGTRC